MFYHSNCWPQSSFETQETEVDVIETEQCCVDREFIANLIQTYINLQIAVAQQYFCFLHFGDNDLPSFVCPLNKQNEEVQLFRKLYHTVVVTYRTEGRMIDLCLKKPFLPVLETFREMLENETVNPFLRHFLFEKPFVDYSHKPFEVLYFQPDAELTLGLFGEQDPFLQYYFGRPLKNLNAPFIPISGFSLSDLENDLYFRSVARLVKKICLVSVPYTFNNRDSYLLQIRWTSEERPAPLDN